MENLILFVEPLVLQIFIIKTFSPNFDQNLPSSPSSDTFCFGFWSSESNLFYLILLLIKLYFELHHKIVVFFISAPNCKIIKRKIKLLHSLKN